MDAETRQRMRSAGLVVWLRASLGHLGGADSCRSHHGGPPAEPHSQPGAARKSKPCFRSGNRLYRECAHRILDVDSQTPEELARTVADWAVSWEAEGSAE